jgi:hypothetical protein
MITVESDRHIDLQRARDLDFSKEMDGGDVVTGYAAAFQLMRTVEMIPWCNRVSISHNP